MEKKHLILLTANYPYGKGETFLENEIDYLAKHFSKIIILSENNDNKQTRVLPSNVSATRIITQLSSIEKVFSFAYCFHPVFLRELFFIVKGLKQSISLHKIKTALFSLKIGFKIKKEVTKVLEKEQLSHKTTFLYSYWMNDAAIALALFNRKTTLCRTHRWDLYFEQNKENYLPFRQFTLNKIQCFSISSMGKEYLEEKVPNNSVQVSRLGTKPLLEKAIKEKAKEKIVLSISNLIPVKRVGLIIEGIAKCSTQNIKWIHFGDGKLFNQLKNKANEKSINFEMKGAVPNTDIIDFLENNFVDLFINLSTSEGIPVSIMEAYSCGIPTIATDVGGTSEIVNNENGFLLSANPTIEEVSETIDCFFKMNETDRMKKRSNSYKTWENKFNAEKNYSDFISRILQL